jgi:16S rRNA (cytosine967-C5)-methyltransferase
LKQPPLARSLAVATHAVAAVLSGKTADAVLAHTPAEVRPAALDLTFTTLRDFGRGDYFLDQLLEKPLKNPSARALLLVALTRLERRPADAHTLVNQAVTTAGKPFKGLVNAVLRNFLRRHTALLAAAETDPVAHWRHPRWWLEALQAAYPEDWPIIAAAGNTYPPLCVRINARRPHLIAGRLLDDSAVLLETPLPVEKIPGFQEGQISVQDWGAQHAARLLELRDGQRVLDACAAPGGKTAHMLERAELALTALEVDAGRAGRITENLERLGLHALVRVADAARPQDWWTGQPFDRILADVPCSASGVVRRHPDIKWLRRPTDVAGFARTQADILDALWPTLAPGGKMLYCTCSVFPEENGEQVRAFVARHPDARRAATGGDGEELQLLPAATHDGFYYALLAKAT